MYFWCIISLVCVQEGGCGAHLHLRFHIQTRVQNVAAIMVLEAESDRRYNWKVRLFLVERSVQFEPCEILLHVLPPPSLN